MIASWCSTLHTPRTRLEPTSPPHAPGMFAILSDPLLYEFIGDDPPESIDALASRYAKAVTRCSPDGTEGWFEWAIVIDDTVAGYAQATAYLTRHEIGLAYVLGSARWNRGYATEVCAALIAHLCTMPALQRFFIDTDVDNQASQRIAEKLGFHREGVRPGASTIRGALRDDVRYVLRV